MESDTMNGSSVLGWLHPLIDEWRHLVDSWMSKQDYLPAIVANISPTYVAIMVSTILAVVITMCLTGSSGGQEQLSTSSEAQATKSRTKSILRKTTPVGKHFSKKTSFAEIPAEVLQQSAKLLEVPEDGSQKFKNKSPPPSPSADSDIDLENDDLEDNKLLRHATRMAEVATKSTEANKSLTETELQEEKRVQTEQLAQIYSMLSKDQEKFGKMSYDELKDQASLYQ